MKKLLGILSTPLKTTFYLCLAIAASQLILIGFISIWGYDSLSWLLYIPFTKGFLHKDLEHFAYNVLIIFFLILFPINRKYDFKKLFLVTSILSLFGIFFDILFNEQAGGISGTLCFLLARVCWSPRKWWGYLIFILLIYPDISFFIDLSDSLSQHNHLIAALIGILSMTTNKFEFKYFLQPSIKGNSHSKKDEVLSTK